MALSILKRLEATTSRLEKEDILGEHADDPTLKTAFRLALDPLVNFYIKKVPEPDASKGVIQPPERLSLASAFQDMQSKICSRLLRGHDARDHVAFLLGCLSRDDQEVLRRVIGRNLKCGVSDATVEKIWPDLKLSYPCMLVSPLNEKTKIKFPCMVQTKMDGMRFNAHVQDGQVSFRSRAGKELDLTGLPIEADFKRFPEGVYDGELLVANCDRKTGNGILTKFQKGTGKAVDGQNIHAQLWDLIENEAFFKWGAWSVEYSKRFALLSARMSGVEPKTIGLVPTWSQVATLEEAQSIYMAQLAKGEEGIILKDPKGPWQDKRVKHQVKMKAELEADLLVTGLVPGSGKYQGKIGALQVESADGRVKSAVGTGLDDDERSWDPEEFLGKIVSVKYNALIDDKKTGQKSLFLPVFVEIRDDKKVPDTL
jgi:ATP-dependent DNA ligase